MMRIKEVLKEHGMTQKDLAEKMGVTDATLSAMVNGNPSIDTLQRIAEAIPVHIAELFVPVVRCPHCGKPIGVPVKP